MKTLNGNESTRKLNVKLYFESRVARAKKRAKVYLGKCGSIDRFKYTQNDLRVASHARPPTALICCGFVGTFLEFTVIQIFSVKGAAQNRIKVN